MKSSCAAHAGTWLLIRGLGLEPAAWGKGGQKADSLQLVTERSDFNL